MARAKPDTPARRERYTAPKEAPQPVPTIGTLHRQCSWWWVYCTSGNCTHGRPLALAPFVIRWGPNESSDRLRRSLLCAKCGHKGAQLMHPSTDIRIGMPELWPTEK